MPYHLSRCIRLKQLLHENDVEPAVELAADFGELGDAGEACRFEQCEDGGGFTAAPADQRVMAGGAGALDQVRQQRAADAAPMAVVVDVDGEFDAVAVGRPA